MCVCAFFLYVYALLSSCHCLICTIVTLKLCTCWVEVNYIPFFKAHFLVCLETINMLYFALKSERDQKNGRNV